MRGQRYQALIVVILLLTALPYSPFLSRASTIEKNPLAEQDLDVNFKTGHYINPVEKGHIAYRTDDLKKFKEHLTENGIKFTDWGNIGVSGWDQIFFYDPDGNVIEVHQKNTDSN